MKATRYTIALLALTTLTMTACKEEPKSKNIITKMPVKKIKKETQKTSDYEQTRDADWVGGHYKVTVSRKADSSLPQVELDDHTKYFDNKVSVTISREDGSVFFQRTFTKDDFAAYVSDATLKKSALLGVVYVKAEGDNIYFAVSVGSPDPLSDEYIPLVMKVSRMGAVTISKDELLDGAPDESQEKTDENYDDGV